MDAVLTITGLTKTYPGGTAALKGVDLSIRRGEIFALLGPNGAGKTTLIGIVCGTVTPGGGTVVVDGHDHVRNFRAARALIGLVPQELHTDAFERVIDSVAFSRGLFGLAPDPAHLRQVLTDLSLWDKRDAKIMELSGGMKRRVLIAKALAHEPRILFLDEPTAGVDVELRRDMWRLVRRLREQGVTIILTTHYIEEAEEMADRVGIIRGGELVEVDETAALMRRLGRRELILTLADPVDMVPPALARWAPSIEDAGHALVYRFDGQAEDTGVPAYLAAVAAAGIGFRDINTRQSSLEDIFVGLVHGPAAGEQAERTGA